MMTSKKNFQKKSIVQFFTLTFIFTIPAYVLITLTGLNIILSPEMVFSFIPVAVLAPISAALVLTYRKSGRTGVKELLKRTFDYKRVKNKKWFLPTLLSMPLLFLLSWGASDVLGLELTIPGVPLIAVPILLISFFISATTENIGWMGYAFEPMRERWGANKATLILAIIWMLWHVPMYLFTFPDSITIVAQLVSMMGLRFLITWLFLNTGKSVFIVIVFHAVYNVCMAVFPVSFVGNATIFIIAAIVVLAYGFKRVRSIA
ncbi:MAG: CPBP family intramembrane metalloprotease [Crocinitomicaceae bacterium]|nr:CPBP family intramembrane metalloprotease [Crocinitomicaceae bacterium]